MYPGGQLIVRTIDKLFFATVLVALLQIPILADHYLQFMSGYYEATKEQVDGFRQTAIRFEYKDTDAMISDHLQNSSPSVREDAKQKLLIIDKFKEIESAIAIFRADNIFKKTVYMLDPSHWGSLDKVIANFKPGIPLSIPEVSYAAILALVINWLGAGLLKLMKRLFKLGTARKSKVYD